MLQYLPSVSRLCLIGDAQAGSSELVTEVTEQMSSRPFLQPHAHNFHSMLVRDWALLELEDLYAQGVC